jgi:hypothetical protein
MPAQAIDLNRFLLAAAFAIKKWAARQLFIIISGAV